MAEEARQMSIGDVNSDERGSGARFNSGKPRLDLVPIIGLESAAQVFEYGAQKYASWNWAKGMPWSAVVGCLMRHLSAIQRGEDLDPESGLPHVGHLMCNALMLATFRETYPEGNDFGSHHLARPAEQKDQT
jgi:hypothetical protein